MARDFDGVDDRITFGSNAAIDDFALRTALMWIDPDDSALAQDSLFTKGAVGLVDDANNSGWRFVRDELAGTGNLKMVQNFSVTDGSWRSPLDGVPEDALRHVGYTYDRGDAANDPVFYVDGVAAATTEVVPPVGDSTGDAVPILYAGTEDGLGQFYDGSLGWIVYDDTILTAADANRHRWWGVAPGGPSTVSFWHPMWTDSLVNKGTVGAVANGTPSPAGATSVTSIPRVERMYCGLMGVGR